MNDEEELERQVGEAMAPVFDDVFRALRSVYDAVGGVEGLAAIQAAVERLDAERARWEAEHPGLRWGQDCHCLHPRWGHHGSVCEQQAETFIVTLLFGQPHRVPMCRPCADLAEQAMMRR